MVNIIIYSISEAWIKSLDYILSGLNFIEKIFFHDDMINEIPVDEKYNNSIILFDCIFVNETCNFDLLEQISLVVNYPIILLGYHSDQNLKNYINRLSTRLKELIILPNGTNNFQLLGYKSHFENKITQIIIRKENHEINMKSIEEIC